MTSKDAGEKGGVAVTREKMVEEILERLRGMGVEVGGR